VIISSAALRTRDNLALRIALNAVYQRYRFAEQTAAQRYAASSLRAGWCDNILRIAMRQTSSQAWTSRQQWMPSGRWALLYAPHFAALEVLFAAVVLA